MRGKTLYRTALAWAVAAVMTVPAIVMLPRPAAGAAVLSPLADIAQLGQTFEKCFAYQGKGVPCLDSDIASIDDLQKQLTAIEATIKANHSEAMRRFNDLETYMIQFQQNQFQQQFTALDVNGTNATNAMDALLTCFKVATNGTCKPYIGGASTGPAQPTKTAIGETTAYLKNQISLLPTNIDATMALFTGTAQGQYQNGAAYLSWFAALRKQDMAAGRSQSRTLQDGTTPVVSWTMAQSVSQDMTYYGHLLKRYGALMILGAVINKNATQAKSYQATVDRYLKGTSPDTVSGSLTEYELPTMKNDDVLFINQGRAALTASSGAGTALTGSELSTMTTAINSYSSASTYFPGTKTVLPPFKNYLGQTCEQAWGTTSANCLPQSPLRWPADGAYIVQAQVSGIKPITGKCDLHGQNCTVSQLPEAQRTKIHAEYKSAYPDSSGSSTCWAAAWPVSTSVYATSVVSRLAQYTPPSGVIYELDGGHPGHIVCINSPRHTAKMSWMAVKPKYLG